MLLTETWCEGSRVGFLEEQMGKEVDSWISLSSLSLTTLNENLSNGNSQVSLLAAIKQNMSALRYFVLPACQCPLSPLVVKVSSNSINTQVASAPYNTGIHLHWPLGHWISEAPCWTFPSGWFSNEYNVHENFCSALGVFCCRLFVAVACHADKCDSK